MQNADSRRVVNASWTLASDARFFVVQVWRSSAAPANLRASVRVIGKDANGRPPEFFDNVESLGRFLAQAVRPAAAGGCDD